MPSITKLKITLDTLHCHLASADVSSEPGNSDEWTMTFTVDGQLHTWHEEYVKTGQDYHLGFVYTVAVDPNNPHKTVQLSAVGVENDSTSADDPLPSAEDTVDPANKWRIGDTYSFSAATSEYAYEIFYKVEVAEYDDPANHLTIATTYVCVFDEIKSASYFCVSAWDPFIKFWTDTSAKKHRLRSVDTYKVDSGQIGLGETTQVIYNGTYVDGSDGYSFYSGLDSAQLAAKVADQLSKGLHVADMDAFLYSATPRFAVVFRAGSGVQQVLTVGLSWDHFWSEFLAFSSSGYRLKCFTSWKQAGKRLWAGAFVPGSGGHTLWVGLEWADLLSKVKTERAAGRWLVDVVSYREGFTQFYAAYFGAGSGQQEVVQTPAENLSATIGDHLKRGLIATRIVTDRFAD